jgi:hypothetical protein
MQTKYAQLMRLPVPTIFDPRFSQSQATSPWDYIAEEPSDDLDLSMDILPELAE